MTVRLLISLGLSRVFLFPLMGQPLRLGLAIIISTLFICVITGMYLSSWYGFILFLIYVGGLLVMFAYVATLSPNTLFGRRRALIFLGRAQILLPLILFFTPFLDFNTLIYTGQAQNNLRLLKACGIELVSPIIISVLISLALILLINLVVVVKICYYQQSALRPYKTK